MRVSASSSSPASTSVTQLWKFPTTGSVYASPVVTDGYVYAGSSFRWGSIGHIYCLNASNGAQIWNYTVDTYLYTGLSVANGIVYTNSGHGVFYALNASTGAEIWNTTEPVWSPVVAGEYLYLGGFGIYCFDAYTGVKIWNYTTEGPLNYPVIADDYVLASGRVSKEYPSEGVVYCLDASSGKRIWNFTTPEMTGTPVVAGGYAYVGAINASVSNNPTDFDGVVYALETSTGSKNWNFPIGRFSSYNPNFVPVVAGHFVYVSVGNKTYALDTLTGTKKWAFTGQYPVGSPLVFSPYIYVTSGSSMHCLDDSTGVEKWVYETMDENQVLGFSSPVVADGQVYVGSAGASNYHHNVCALDAITGAKIWNYAIEGDADSLTVDSGVVYVGSEGPDEPRQGNGAVYALKPTVTSSPSPSTPLSDLQLTVIVAATVVVILAVVFLVYRTRAKGAKGSPTAPLPPQP